MYTFPRMRYSRWHSFSKTEVKELLVSWLALSFCFAFTRQLSSFIILFPISLLVVGAAFVVHELSHKLVAQRFGLMASYRMWSWGILLALLTAILTELIGRKIIFAAPGAVYIFYPVAPFYLDYERVREAEIKISIAGPLSNIIMAFLFFFISQLGGWFFLLGYIGFQVNAFLAFFNLLPFPPMDGWKIFRGNIVLWVILFLISIVTMTYLGV